MLQNEKDYLLFKIGSLFYNVETEAEYHKETGLYEVPFGEGIFYVTPEELDLLKMSYDNMDRKYNVVYTLEFDENKNAKLMVI